MVNSLTILPFTTHPLLLDLSISPTGSKLLFFCPIFLSEKCEVIFEKIIAEHGNVVNEAMKEAVKATPIISDSYDESKSFVEQSPMMQGVTRPRLRKKFPEMFKAVDEEYEKQVGEIDKQIEELRS